MPYEEFVKLGETREGEDGLGAERDGAIVFARLHEFVDEPEDDDEVLLETNYEGLCLS